MFWRYMSYIEDENQALSIWKIPLYIGSGYEISIQQCSVLFTNKISGRTWNEANLIFIPCTVQCSGWFYFMKPDREIS